MSDPYTITMKGPWQPGAVTQARQDLKDFSMEGKIVPVLLQAGRSITIGRDGVGIASHRGPSLSWSRDEAVFAAKAILEYYGDTP